MKAKGWQVWSFGHCLHPTVPGKWPEVELSASDVWFLLCWNPPSKTVALVEVFTEKWDRAWSCNSNLNLFFHLWKWTKDKCSLYSFWFLPILLYSHWDLHFCPITRFFFFFNLVMGFSWYFLRFSFFKVRKKWEIKKKIWGKSIELFLLLNLGKERKGKITLQKLEEYHSLLNQGKFK